LRIGHSGRTQSSSIDGLARSTRRRFLRTAVAAGSALAVAAVASGPAARVASAAILPTLDARAETPSVSADDALKMLMDGNARYVASKAEHPRQSPERREEVATGQHPFAIILGCSDSRVGPEVVFDRGLGDLFVIRVAGNTLDQDSALGTIEYGLEELGAPLVMVLGHERCGAVKATLDLAESGGSLPGHIGALVDPIKPALDDIKGQPGDALDNLVRANVVRVTEQLKNSEPIVAEFFHDGRVKIVGALYDLETGQVEVIA
jgi:carbonic anhydrase